MKNGWVQIGILNTKSINLVSLSSWLYKVDADYIKSRKWIHCGSRSNQGKGPPSIMNNLCYGAKIDVGHRQHHFEVVSKSMLGKLGAFDFLSIKPLSLCNMKFRDRQPRVTLHKFIWLIVTVIPNDSGALCKRKVKENLRYHSSLSQLVDTQYKMSTV